VRHAQWAVHDPTRRIRDDAASCFNLSSAAKSSGINAAALLVAAGHHQVQHCFGSLKKFIKL
jgi:hypothetical protein